MTSLQTASIARSGDAPSAVALADHASTAGFAVLAAAAWPESAADVTAPTLAGFVASSFSPIAAEVARRCLSRRQTPAATTTAVIVASALGDLAAARHVAQAVDVGDRVGPLLFFQCVPNAVAGHIAARWSLTGPVVCLGGVRAALETAALLIEDADADEVLLIRVDQAVTAQDRDRAEAVLLGAELLGAGLRAGVPTHERGQG